MKKKDEPIKDKTDEALMVAYQNGEYWAFEEIYRRYKGKVYGYIQKKTQANRVEDIFQNVFSKLHEKKNKYDKQYPFTPWFFSLIKNCIVDVHRVESKFLNSNEIEESVAYAPTSPELALSLKEALQEIKSEYREVIEMRYLKGMGFEEISKTLSVTPVNLRQRLSRGIKKLKHIFEKGEG